MSSLSLLFGSLARSFRKPLGNSASACPVCRDQAGLLDSVDFNKSCEEARGVHLPPSGESVAYYLCGRCGFCFAPDLKAWSMDEFERRIYNDGYREIDPDYVQVRPENNAELLHTLFSGSAVRHLDYGGGPGLLSRILTSLSWDSRSYDPFVDKDVRIDALGTFDLVTAFEVFEHVPNVDALFADLTKLLRPDGMLVFSTLLSDGEIARGKPLTWWYASPRNGHISLFSADSLRIETEKHDLELRSLSENLHAAFRTVPPPWANRLIR